MIEVKNILIEKKLSHLKLPRKPLLILWEADLDRSIGVAHIKKREGLYYADLEFSPIVEIKNINIDSFFPSLITRSLDYFESQILALALGIYPNKDSQVKRISDQLEEKKSYKKTGPLFETKLYTCKKHKEYFKRKSFVLLLCADCVEKQYKYYPYKLINGKTHEQAKLS